jgi:uncharacterized protein
LNWNLINNGQLAEQFIGQHLRYNNDIDAFPELYYWIRQGRSNAKVDYVVAHKNNVVPIEVKSGKSGALRSLHQFMNEKKASLAVRFLDNEPVIELVSVKLPNGEVSYKLISLPHYFVGQVSRLIDEVM